MACESPNGESRGIRGPLELRIESLFGWAEARSHLVDVDEAVAARVDFLHEFLDLFVRHLGAHVRHVLFELGHGNLLVVVLVEVPQLGHHVLRRVFVLQLVLHHEL